MNRNYFDTTADDVVLDPSRIIKVGSEIASLPTTIMMMGYAKSEPGEVGEIQLDMILGKYVNLSCLPTPLRKLVEEFCASAQTFDDDSASRGSDVANHETPAPTKIP